MPDKIEITFSPNSSIDAEIKAILPLFSSESQARMRKAILNAKKSAIKHQDENTDAHARHIFREFIPSSILNQNGFSFEYEKPIGGKRPDWLDTSEKILLESYTFERGASSPFMDRLTSSITDKCIKYKNIIVENCLSFIVVVYLDFLSCMTLDDCSEDPKMFRPVFDANNSLSAILFFSETNVINGRQQYGFFCICVNPSLGAMPNWPFKTIYLNQ
jgi:hypothetical protein